jgi:hypothetical protein
MVLHQLREQVVFRAEAILEVGDAALGLEVRPFGSASGTLQGEGAVLKELLEPPVEDRRLQLGLIADRRDRDLVDQVAAQQRHLLCGRGVLPRAFHLGALRVQFYGWVTPFPAEALQAVPSANPASLPATREPHLAIHGWN